MKEFKGTKEDFNFELIESRNWFNIHSEKGIIARTFYGDAEPIVTVEESHANAKLICAAPDLLKNLIRCVDRLEENGMGDMSAVRRAKEAIKKALD